MKKILAFVVVSLLLVAPAAAQWQTSNHSIPIGQGAGKTGFRSAAPGVLGQPFVSGGPSADPAFGTIANSGFTPGPANTVKGSLDGASVVDIPQPDCQAASSALRYVPGSGPVCGNVVVRTGFDSPVNLGLTSSAAAGALTINVTQANGASPSASSPVLVPFRSATLSSGAVTWGTVSSPLSLTVPSGASLGATNNVPFRVWIFLDYNGGTPAIGVATCSNPTTIFGCSSWEYSLKTSVTINGSSTSGGVLYAANGATLDSVRIVGYCDYPSGLATAGVWASQCSSLQVVGAGVKKPGDVVQTTSAKLSTLNITPTSAINLIKFSATFNCNAPSAAAVVINFVRGVTPLWSQYLAGSGSTGMGTAASAALIDMPATVAPTTYSITNTGTACGSQLGTILLDEIMG